MPCTSCPLQTKVRGADPPVQNAVNVTVPPPGGRESGTGVIVHAEGAEIAGPSCETTVFGVCMLPPALLTIT